MILRYSCRGRRRFTLGAARRDSRWVAAIALALLVSPVWAEDPPADPEVSSYPLVFRSDDRKDVVATTVLDGRTGRPIRGAIVRGYAEGVSGRAAAVNALVCSLTTDEQGIASARLDTEALGCSHWTVTAPGYRPYAEFHGYWPPTRVLLKPGTPMAVRVLDAMGRSVVDVAVEGYEGCPHAPAAVRGRTDANGIFRVEDGSARGYELWVEAAGCARRPESLQAVFGDTPDTCLLRPGIDVRGRLTDVDGRPIHGAVVRGTGYPRGPATLTDSDGRFVLSGLGVEDGVQVFHPTLAVEGETTHMVRRVAADAPLDLVWTVEGLALPPARGTLVIAARDGKGAPGSGLHLLVIGRDGRCYPAATDDSGAASLEVPCGEVRVRGDSPFDPYEVAETTAVVRQAETSRVDLAFTARPRFQIEGGVAPDVDASLAAAGRVYDGDLLPTDKGAPPPVWLPADAPAVLRLSAEQETSWSFQEVGPVVDGVRTVKVRPRPAHRVRIAPDDRLDGAWVFVTSDGGSGEGRPYDVVHGVISFFRGGRFRIVVDTEGDSPARVVSLELPPLAQGAIERSVDLAKEGQIDHLSGTARLLVTMADGKAVPEMKVSGDRFSVDGAESPVEVSAPDSVLLAPVGLQPLQVFVPRAGDQKVLFPTGGIDLSTTDAAGAPVTVSVLIDGVEHRAAEGHLALRGLAAGAHAVIVQRESWPPRVPESRIWRFTLADGEVRAKTLPLP
ncbi:MAG: carboxypeptidase-like regulatory domain-containing protein [Planctomycetota bacterium]